MIIYEFFPIITQKCMHIQLFKISVMSQDQKPIVTPEDVLKFEKPTQGFLCDIDANIYDIQFIFFKVRQCQTNEALFQIQKKPEDIGKQMTEAMRTIRYHFGPLFFQMKTIGTTLQFKVGGKPVNKFKMIERHYFKNQLIKSYEFDSPFCMPNSTNEMEAMYELPDLSAQKIQGMIESPWQTVADSFYFVEDKLVMHTKALFNYAPLIDIY